MIDHKQFDGHTPGKWVTSLTMSEKTGFVMADRPGAHAGYVVAEVPLDRNYKNQAKANARLIAAAPALLADNKRLREALEKSAVWMDFVAGKLGDPGELDKNIRKYGARAWIKQFGEGASHRATEARAALSGDA